MKTRSASQSVVVLGAGLSGLSAAYHLGAHVKVYEAQARAGGVCATDYIQNYAFDQAGHLLHVRTPEIKRLIQRLLPRAFNTITRDARIHLLGSEVRYPIQANLFGLPPQIKAAGLQDYLEAITAPNPKLENFSTWAQATFGKTLSQLFFEPYNRKLWTVEPAELTLEWMGRFVPQPEINRIIQGAFSDVAAGGGYNAQFWYPRRGGIDCLARAMTRKIPGLHLQARAMSVDVRRRTVGIMGHGQVAWQQLVSTLPLPRLALMLASAPKRVADAARHLRANSVLVVNLGVKRAPVHPAHWLYFPEEKYCFYRVGFPSNYGRVAPAGHSSLYAEVALPWGTGWDQRGRIAKQVRRDLASAGILAGEDNIEIEHLQYLPNAYVIYNSDYSNARKTILEYLEKSGIHSIGRWGAWEYSSMEDALLAGRSTADTIKS